MKFPAAFLVIGATLGAGLFSAPLLVPRVGGAFISLYYVVIGLAVVVMQAMFAEVVRHVGNGKRLNGCVEAMLGKRVGMVVTVAVFASAISAMLAYVVLWGDFAARLFGLLTAAQWSVLGTLLIAGLVWRGQKEVTKWDKQIVAALLALIALLVASRLNAVQAPVLLAWNGSQWMAPFGVVLFSLLGMNAMPELPKVLGPRWKEKIVPVTAQGSMAALGISWGFVLMLGASVARAPWQGTLLNAIGFVAITSVFLLSAQNLKETLVHDHAFKKGRAWLLTFVPVLALFLAGARDLLTIVGIGGGILGASLALFLIASYLKIPKSTRQFRVPLPVTVLVTLLFALGFLSELYNIL